MPKTIYLASPYGFSAQQKTMLLPPIVSALEELGLEVLGAVRSKQPGGYLGDRLGVPDRPEGCRGRGGSGRHLRGGQRRPAG